ncbi:MAG: pentapeptide repeat-containing protein [Deltaproteobacteria bacterium]|nr:MAG: pentapeptide repeat-containing protein [Deltaproteobacteria bacterium]
MDLDPTKNDLPSEERDLAKNKHQPPANAEELLARYAAGERAFARARLSKAYLQGAQLSGADFSGANFSDANLEDADLRDAILQGANLQRTALRDVNLENADLTKAAGLLPAQLGGANLCGARLPDRFGDFDGLKIVEEESKNARTLFFGILLACVYGWLTIASTTDALLLTNSSSSQLPVISASIPIVSFYIVGPLMLFVLYMYLHLHLQRLWERLADLPAVFPDGRSLGKRAYPWLLTGLVYSYNPYLKNRRPPLSRLQTAISLLVTWWLMPLTILLFWTRYLRRHEWISSSSRPSALASCSTSSPSLPYEGIEKISCPGSEFLPALGPTPKPPGSRRWEPSSVFFLSGRSRASIPISSQPGASPRSSMPMRVLPTFANGHRKCFAPSATILSPICAKSMPPRGCRIGRAKKKTKSIWSSALVFAPPIFALPTRPALF